jgi:hypothetical protein
LLEAVSQLLFGHTHAPAAGTLAEYEATRSAMFQVDMSRIQALAGRAVETLEDLLGAKQYPAVRLGGGTHGGRNRDAPVRRRHHPPEVGQSRSSAAAAEAHPEIDVPGEDVDPEDFE